MLGQLCDGTRGIPVLVCVRIARMPSLACPVSTRYAARVSSIIQYFVGGAAFRRHAVGKPAAQLVVMRKLLPRLSLVAPGTHALAWLGLRANKHRGSGIKEEECGN
jgi:hypothetical protein